MRKIFLILNLIFLPSVVYPSETDLPSIKLLIKSAKNKDSGIRRDAAEKLGRTHSREACPVLIKLLKDSDVQVRISAVTSLGLLGYEEGVEPLIKVVKKDELVRPKAIVALGELKNPQAVPVIQSMLLDSNSQVVFAAAVALGKIGGTSSGQAMAKALENADDYSCQAIVNSMGKLKDPASIDPLLQLVNQESYPRPLCLASAIDTLGIIRDPRSIPVLINKFPTFPIKSQIQALRSLGRLKAQPAYELASNLALQSGSLQEAAIECIIGIGDTRAIGVLKKIKGQNNRQ